MYQICVGEDQIQKDYQKWPWKVIVHVSANWNSLLYDLSFVNGYEEAFNEIPVVGNHVVQIDM